MNNEDWSIQVFNLIDRVDQEWVMKGCDLKCNYCTWIFTVHREY